jgi:transcriptional regulator with XRE-family HTH domain
VLNSYKNLNADAQISAVKLDATQRRQELAAFLRAHRARLSPEEVGLPSSLGYRRTPGLRREELAQLAGVGLTWYTWLEQGRAIQVSREVLESLARALRLNATEKLHLFSLAQAQPASYQSPEPFPGLTISPLVRSFVESLETGPVFVLGSRWEVVAYNRLAQAVFGKLAFMNENDPHNRNIIWHTFMSPDLRDFMVDWQSHAQNLLAQFRVTQTHAIGEDWLTELITELNAASTEFQSWWAEQEVLDIVEGRKELNHPEVGLLILEQLTLQVPATPELKIVVYTPERDDISSNTKSKLAQLLAAL